MYSEQIGHQASDFDVVTDRPIDLDARRGAEGKLGIDLRRKAANSRFSPEDDSEKLEAEAMKRLQA
jgi:hypothetical protein